ncbi:hypothetical protein FSP39_020733 [Pinctada imbricata]|uniref:Uncharacterized protein n=1 Tax=Pinctada imbricata TaxID=66713 RepID=A0AA88YL23_PINIB|nr:hypothetical protein FSP39_020733 [Pinctada imbricata]
MNVRPIKSCPTTFDLFKSRGRNLGCSVGNEYHCMVNEQKREVEFCLSRSWIQPDHCPEYISFASQIDQYACNRSKGVCPPIVYWSNTSFSSTSLHRLLMTCFISQLIRYAKASTKYTDFVLRARRLSDKFLSQGYVCDRLTSSLRKFYGRFGELVIHNDVPLSRMVDDILA